ncbi:general secretion pathway protein GspL [Rubrivivax gelatinosus]|uniref:type II secretion system protein GspL n=1 Tax=Rubrivivax gelatinosus TaxID=28068 RepID=UPI00190539D6|nr:type II secretion system protein GspL [Rubrivivax gelatinosus]MBK1613769.1 general secretion pathway protein GspL [Rubrivivax gelatinosus]
MSVLVLQIPPRQRLGSRAADEPAPPRTLAEVDYVFSPDGLAVGSSGRAAPALLPRADSVLAVLADADVAWQRITLPKAPPARLRAALAGVLEELLLDDEDALHFALAPQAAAGATAWVAVLHRGWLAGVIAQLEAAGVGLDRIVPSALPGTAGGHFFSPPDAASDAAPWLSLVREDGLACLDSAGTLARALLPADPGTLHWTATPAAAAAAEKFIGVPVTVLTEAERALQAARSPWNLRQFELAPRQRGMRLLRDAARRLLSPEWRPVRWGAAALVLVQLVGLNAWAWQQRRAVDERRTAMTALLQQSFPGVRAVIDAPLQMRREAERLRAAAGRAGDGDLEVLLAAAAAAWPEGQGPAQTLRFEAGRLTLAAAGWSEPEIAAFRDRLRPAGYGVEVADGRITLVRSGAAA